MQCNNYETIKSLRNRNIFFAATTKILFCVWQTYIPPDEQQVVFNAHPAMAVQGKHLSLDRGKAAIWYTTV